MFRLLFVCHGNICRSPMAEYVMKFMVKEIGKEAMFYIDSAATSTEEIGNGVHYGTRNRLRQAGIPCGEHKARQITPADYKEFDLIIGMDKMNIRNMKRLLGDDKEGKLHMLLEYAGLDRDIADPWYTGNFDETFDDVCKGCKGLLNYLLKN